jgi:hypothetical protein
MARFLREGKNWFLGYHMASANEMQPQQEYAVQEREEGTKDEVFK